MSDWEWTVRAKQTFGGGTLTYNQHDDLNAAIAEAIQVGNGAFGDPDLDGVWIEDLAGDVVWAVGASPRAAVSAASLPGRRE